MKTNLLFSLCAASAGAILFLAACSKQEEPATAPSASKTEPPAAAPVPAPPAAAADAQKSADTAAADAQKQAGDAKVAADTSTKDAAKTAETLKAPDAPATPPVPGAPDAGTDLQSVVKHVKTLMSQKKYSEALAALSQLSTSSLSNDQQNMVAQLKTQIETAMAGQAGNDALKSVGGLPKK